MDHPRVQLAVVFAAALSAPWMQPSALAILAGAALLWHLYLGGKALRSLGRALWRLKWLLLAIAIVFLWLPEESGGMALRLNWEQIGEGLHRACVVAVMMAIVHGLVYRHSAAVLGAILAGILSPLDRLGLPGRRFGIRLGLLMAQVGAEREHLSRLRAELGQKFSLRAVPALLAGEIHRIERAAEPEFRPWPEIPPASWRARLSGTGFVLGLAALLWW